MSNATKNTISHSEIYKKGFLVSCGAVKHDPGYPKGRIRQSGRMVSVGPYNLLDPDGNIVINGSEKNLHNRECFYQACWEYFNN